jgi:hypothetical protein
MVIATRPSRLSIAQHQYKTRTETGHIPDAIGRLRLHPDLASRRVDWLWLARAGDASIVY